jgi:PAS domain-containing protein
MALSEAQRRELADFLRNRRAELSPAAVGLPEFGRRRTPGLRREEVAQLAAISPSWYTWLEQSRDIRVSPLVLSSIARALQLDTDGTDHLFQLAGEVPPRKAVAAHGSLAPLRLLLDVLRGCPAYVIDPRWEIAAWNTEAADLFGAEFEALDPDQRNALLFAVTGRYTPLRFVDRPAIVPALLAEFRADAGRHLGDESFDALVEHLQRESPLFRQLWSRHEVRRRPYGPMEYDHPVVGRLTFNFLTLQLGESAELRVHVYIPDPDTATADRLRKLGEVRRGVA